MRDILATSDCDCSFLPFLLLLPALPLVGLQFFWSLSSPGEVAVVVAAVAVVEVDDGLSFFFFFFFLFALILSRSLLSSSSAAVGTGSFFVASSFPSLSLWLAPVLVVVIAVAS